MTETPEQAKPQCCPMWWRRSMTWDPIGGGKMRYTYHCSGCGHEETSIVEDPYRDPTFAPLRPREP